MSQATKRNDGATPPAMRVLGRGLGAKRGVRLTLRGLREGVGLKQTDVAESSGIDQGDVSRLEARSDIDDCQVGTLRRYIAALGGGLEVIATFGNKRITLTVPDADEDG